MTPEQQVLSDKACSRKTLGREEQRRLGLEFRDALTLNKWQAKCIREMRDEIIRLKIGRSSATQNKQEINVTFEEEITSNECNTKEITSFEDILYEQFKKYEQDWDGLERVLDKFHKLEQEKNESLL